MDNFSFTNNEDEIPTKPAKIEVPPKKSVPSNEEKIENIISNGGSATIDVDSHEYNRLYDLYKPARKSGKIRMSYDGISKAEINSEL